VTPPDLPVPPPDWARLCRCSGLTEEEVTSGHGVTCWCGAYADEEDALCERCRNGCTFTVLTLDEARERAVRDAEWMQQGASGSVNDRLV